MRRLHHILITDQIRKLGGAEFKIATYLYYLIERQTEVITNIRTLAETTGLSWRQTQSALQGLAMKGILQVDSRHRETRCSLPPGFIPVNTNLPLSRKKRPSPEATISDRTPPQLPAESAPPANSAPAPILPTQSSLTASVAPDPIMPAQNPAQMERNISSVVSPPQELAPSVPPADISAAWIMPAPKPAEAKTNISPTAPPLQELERIQKAEQVQRIVGTLMDTRDLMTPLDSQMLLRAADGNLDRLLARLQTLVSQRLRFDNFLLLCSAVRRMVLVR